MKKLLITIIIFTASIISCNSQKLYITIDSRDTVNILTRIHNYYYIYAVGENRVDYIIFKEDPEERYGGGIYLVYKPYKDSVLENSSLKKLRTKNISISQWDNLRENSDVRVVNGKEWVQATKWDSLYKQLYKYYYKGDMYIVDKKYLTKDSIQVRGVHYFDVRAQY